jgi:hypothetical protein
VDFVLSRAWGFIGEQREIAFCQREPLIDIIDTDGRAFPYGTVWKTYGNISGTPSNPATLSPEFGIKWEMR